MEGLKGYDLIFGRGDLHPDRFLLPDGTYATEADIDANSCCSSAQRIRST